MKKVFLFTLILSFIVFTNIYAETVWYKTYGSSYDDEGYSIKQTSDNSYIVAGFIHNVILDNDDVLLIKTDALGNKEWDQTFGGLEDDKGFSVQQTTDGGYVVAGATWSTASGEPDGFLIKTDPNGVTQWSQTYGDGFLDEIHSVQQTTEGGFILAGFTYNPIVDSVDIWLLKVDSSGNEEWNQTFGGEALDEAYSVAQTADGGYILTGKTWSYGDGESDAFLIKTDSLGIDEWAQTYGTTHSDEAYSVVQTTDGGFVFTGYAYNSITDSNDLWVCKTDASGVKDWSQCFGTSYQDAGFGVNQTLDGGFIVTGLTNPWDFPPNSNIFLMKMNAGGGAEWTQIFGGAFDDVGKDVIETTDGGFMLTGYTKSVGAGGSDVCIVYYKPGIPCEINITEENVELSYPSGGDCPPSEYQLTLSYEGCEGSILWSSSDENVAIVDSLGNVIAQATGTAEITAKCSDNPGCNDTCAVNVAYCTPPCWVDIAEESINLSYPGGGDCDPTEYQLNFGYGYCSGEIIWSSSDEAIAYVNAEGYVVAQATGTAVITVECSATSPCLDTCQVNIAYCEPPQCYVDITEDSVDLSYPGGETCDPNQYQLGIEFDCGYLPPLSSDIFWHSLDEYVATVDQDGIVTAVGTGTTTIVAECIGNPDCVDTCQINVAYCEYFECWVDISESEVYLSYPGGGDCSPVTAQLNVSYDYCDGSIKWASFNEGVATVDENGLVTAVGTGEATITAYYSGDDSYYDSCNVYVSYCEPSQCWVDISESEVYLSFPGGGDCSPVTAQLNVSYNYCDGTILWIRSNEGVATVDENGLVTAVGTGEVTITAYCSGDTSCYDSCNVYVSYCEPGYCWVDISEEDIVLTYPSGGDCSPLTAQLNVSYDFCDGSILWNSSNPAVAAVDENGLVTAVGTGEASITAYCSVDEYCYGECNVYVSYCEPSQCWVNIEEESIELSYPSSGDECPPSSALLNASYWNCQQGIYWFSSDDSVVTVDEYGLVTAVGTGEATVYAQCVQNVECSDQCSVVVNICPVEENSPPYMPTLLTPQSDASNIDLDVEFNWVNNGDPDGDETRTWLYVDRWSAGNWQTVVSFDAGSEESLYVILDEESQFRWTVCAYDPGQNSNPWETCHPCWYFTTKNDDRREIIWQKTYGGSGNGKASSGDDRAFCALPVGSGYYSGYALVGYTDSYGAGGKDLWVVKTDSIGNKVWDRTFGGSEDDQGNYFQEIWYESPSGGFVIAGQTDSFGNGNTDAWLLKTDFWGNQKWSYTFGGAKADAAMHVQEVHEANTLENGYLVTGYTESYGAGGSDMWVIKTDANGLEEWNTTYGTTGDECGNYIILSNDENFIVTGWSDPERTGNRDLMITRLQPEETKADWTTHTYGGDNKDEGTCVKQTSDGGFIITGYTCSYIEVEGHEEPIINTNGDANVWLLKTDADGNKEWGRTFGGNQDDRGLSVEETWDGGFIITGYTCSFSQDGKADAWLIKTNAQGNEEWNRTFGGAGEDIGYHVNHDFPSTYTIAGYTNSYGAGGFDMWLIYVYYPF